MPSISQATRIGEKQLESLAQLCKSILEDHNQHQPEFYNKLEYIDTAYYMYKASAQQGDGTGKDVVHGEAQVGVILDEFTIPIVVSQVDTFVGYLAEVYLSGFPIFPVASTPEHQKQAEQLEAIIDSHATQGSDSYPRHLLKAFRNGIKYNFMPIALEWETLPYYQIAANYLTPTEKAKVKKSSYMYNKLTSLDPYNTVWDRRVAPVDLALKGEWGGHLELISRIELKRLLSYYMSSQKGYNYGKAFQNGYKERGMPASGTTASYYRSHPQISDYISRDRKSMLGTTNWLAWVKGINPRLRNISSADVFERFKGYIRIIPSEHGITNVPEPNTPQIWKIDMILPETIICAERIITILDLLPIMIGQPLEDDFELQTPSVAESEIPFQDSASKLINVRFSGARRAISDRALYNPDMVRSSDVNNPVAAPKIPVRIPLGSTLTLQDAYKEIPYRDQELQGVVQDAVRIVEFSHMLHGSNRATQGQFQKGNKTRKEWEDVMGASNNRLRLPAIQVEYQSMLPIKEQIRWNIFMHGVDGVFQNYRTGESLKITPADLDKIKTNIQAFKLADGYTPTEKIIPTELLSAGINLISVSPILQQAYGPALPKMFSHMMSLGGVQNLDQYLPVQGQQAIPGGTNVASQPGVPTPSGAIGGGA